MRLFLAAALACLPFCASAQIAGSRPYEPAVAANPFIGDSRLPGPSLGRDLRQARADIRRAREAGFVSGREARQLRREARAIEQLAGFYAGDGLSDPERRELASRTQYLRSRTR
jgi:hypothetical protein